jgi:hypothetical protein
MWSLETAAYDIEAIVRTQPRVKQPVQHVIISLNEAESRTLSDDDLIRRSEAAIDRAGFAGHQAIFTVHRDTDNAHCHVAVASVNVRTLKAWNRYHGWNRLHRALRELELEHGMQIEHGLAVVRDAGLPTQRIEPATKAERLMWARDRGLAQERLEDLAHTFLGDAEGLELPDDRRERIVTKLRKMFSDIQDRREVPLRQRAFAETLSDAKRSRRLAAIKAVERRELELIDKRFALESFVAWSVGRRKEIEYDASFLESIATAGEYARAQRSKQKRHVRLDGIQEDRRQSIQPQSATPPAVEHTLEGLLRDWSRIVGLDRSSISRPLGMVDNQLIVEVDRSVAYSDHEITLAVQALGRSQIDRVIVKLVDNIGQTAGDRTRVRSRRR